MKKPTATEIYEAEENCRMEHRALGIIRQRGDSTKTAQKKAELAAKKLDAIYRADRDEA